MSRGIGDLQKEIMASLDSAMEHHISYSGNLRHHGNKPDWFYSRGYVSFLREDLIIHPDVYDLRAVLKYLSLQNEDRQCGNYTEDGFQASFSRAIKSLIKRGYLGDVTYYLPLHPMCKDLKERGRLVKKHHIFTMDDGLDRVCVPPTKWRIRFVVDLTSDKWYDTYHDTYGGSRSSIWMMNPERGGDGMSNLTGIEQHFTGAGSV